MFLTHKTFLRKLSDHKLCHSTSKPIDDVEDTFKSFMTFDITSRGSKQKQIVVLPTEANTLNPQESSQPLSQANHTKPPKKQSHIPPNVESIS